MYTRKLVLFGRTLSVTHMEEKWTLAAMAFFTFWSSTSKLFCDWVTFIIHAMGNKSKISSFFFCFFFVFSCTALWRSSYWAAYTIKSEGQFTIIFFLSCYALHPKNIKKMKQKRLPRWCDEIHHEHVKRVSFYVSPESMSEVRPARKRNKICNWKVYLFIYYAIFVVVPLKIHTTRSTFSSCGGEVEKKKRVEFSPTFTSSEISRERRTVETFYTCIHIVYFTIRFCPQ